MLRRIYTDDESDETSCPLGIMYAFTRQLRYLQHTHRFSILSTDSGWEVREERDSKIVRRATYQDWHRVERARRSITIELDNLRRNGWSEA